MYKNTVLIALFVIFQSYSSFASEVRCGLVKTPEDVNIEFTDPRLTTLSTEEKEIKGKGDCVHWLPEKGNWKMERWEGDPITIKMKIDKQEKKIETWTGPDGNTRKEEYVNFTVDLKWSAEITVKDLKSKKMKLLGIWPTITTRAVEGFDSPSIFYLYTTIDDSKVKVTVLDQYNDKSLRWIGNKIFNLAEDETVNFKTNGFSVNASTPKGDVDSVTYEIQGEIKFYIDPTHQYAASNLSFSLKNVNEKDDGLLEDFQVICRAK